MVDPKRLMKELLKYGEEYGMAVLSLSNGQLVREEDYDKMGMWSLTDSFVSDHPSHLPAKDLRKALWDHRDNKWFQLGQGVAWCVFHPEMQRYIAGLAILVGEDKAQRLIDAGSERVFIRKSPTLQTEEVY